MLKEELEKIWCVKATMVPVVVWALVTVIQKLCKWLQPYQEPSGFQDSGRLPEFEGNTSEARVCASNI